MKGKNKRKPTIFRIFLIPLITIMLAQGMITIGTLVVRRTGATLEEYSSSMMARLVENRGVILQNDMNQRWASVCEQEAFMNDILGQFLEEEGVTGLWDSREMRTRFLGRLFPECLRFLQNNTTTGVFVILTGGSMETPGEYDGFFIRDSDPHTNPANFSDLLLERGDKQLSRQWNIPLDTFWTTRFHMEGRGQNPAEDYFYEPWRAGVEYKDAQTLDLGYWSVPFHLEKEAMDGYEMITYSLPLRFEGEVYGVLGVEISVRQLNEYFPAGELNDAGQSGYLLAVEREDGKLAALAGKGVLYNQVCVQGGQVTLEKTRHPGLSLVEGIRMGQERIYGVT